ncbi:MAG: DoxX family protein [Steroidobacteraceae bacterium]
MGPTNLLHRANELAERLARPLPTLLLLAIRFYVPWQFFKAGLVKLEDWNGTLWLFREEYHVPVLPPDAAALLGTAGELAFPVLLALGLLTRWAALGLSFVNAMAVVSYSHVLFADGYEAALGQHVLWGSLLAVLVVFGGGRASLDAWIASRR